MKHRPTNRPTSLVTVTALTLVLGGGCANKKGARGSETPPGHGGNDATSIYSVEHDTKTVPLHYKFRSTTGREVSDVTNVDVPKLFLFLTSYDLASQSQATFAKRALRRAEGKVACAVFFLERPNDAMLIDVYMKTVQLPCPAIIISQEQLSKTELGMVRSVPTTTLLDRSGRVVWIAQGVTPEEKLSAVLLRYAGQNGRERHDGKK